jgi:hypothetical protein
MSRDWRAASEILSEPRWKNLAPRADQVDVVALRDVDRLLYLCETEGISHIDDITEEIIDRVDAGSASASYQHRLSKALRGILPGTLLADRAAAVARRRQQLWRATRPSRKTGRTYVSKKSVAEADLPLSWRMALVDMRAGFASSTSAPPAPKIVETIVMKLRQLAKSAQEAGLEVSLSVETLTALHSDMTARDIASTTKRATCSALGAFAKYIDAPSHIREELRRLTALHDAQARLEPTRKEAILHETDVSFSAVLAKAQELLERSHSARNPRSALTLRNSAFSLAFFTILPLRLSDTRFRFGEELTWEGGHWTLHLTTQKTAFDLRTRLTGFLTPYIEAVLLHGLDAAYLDGIRDTCIAEKRPVLVTRSGAGVAYHFVSDVWRKHFGTGEHIARTEIHEAFAQARGAEGTDLALAACAQSSIQTAGHYHTQRLKRSRLDRMQAELLNLQNEFPEGTFDVR